MKEIRLFVKRCVSLRNAALWVLTAALAGPACGDGSGGSEDAGREDMQSEDPAAEDVTVEEEPEAEVLDGEDVQDAADEEETGFVPYPAPDFTLADMNPASPTYEETRSLSDEAGKVIILFFVSYG